MKTGRRYEVQIEDGQKIRNKCLVMSNDSVIFKARTAQLNFSKKNIKYIKKKRTSPLTYASAVVLTSVAILSVTTNKKEPIFDSNPND